MLKVIRKRVKTCEQALKNNIGISKKLLFDFDNNRDTIKGNKIMQIVHLK